MKLLEYALADESDSSGSVVHLKNSVFGSRVLPYIVLQVVNWQLAKRRSGNHSTLTRSDVRGTTKKCKPQKEQGTRHGDKRAPIFRKGGVAFGPKPRDYEHSLNKKVRKLGLISVLSDKVNNKLITIIDDVALYQHKTAELSKQLQSLGIEKALFISDQFDDNFRKAASNLVNVDLLPVAGVNVYDMLKHKNLVITKSGVEALHNRLS